MDGLDRIIRESEIIEEQDRNAPTRVSFDMSRFEKTNKKGTPRSLRDSVLNDALDFLEWSADNKRQLGQMLRAFKGKTPREIYKHMATAKQEGKNPKALFRYLMGMVKTKK